ncbi:hypothetical protein HYN04_04855 [Phenylobacterium parvum]|uniref:Uncharacterized protein n=1 Tax=Phenylobacterium parvum TaxID=2201350 RepID=A0A2Z3HN50_9CAUL|nr:hypothetical protein HYN04_04855 [Phenylobacterium parvum]
MFLTLAEARSFTRADGKPPMPTENSRHGVTASEPAGKAATGIQPRAMRVRQVANPATSDLVVTLPCRPNGAPPAKPSWPQADNCTTGRP